MNTVARILLLLSLAGMVYICIGYPLRDTPLLPEPSPYEVTMRNKS